MVGSDPLKRSPSLLGDSSGAWALGAVLLEVL